MDIRGAMNPDVATIRLGSTIYEAAVLLSETQASDLVVLDDDDCFAGVLSEGDLIRAVMPKFEDMMFECDSVHGAFDVFVEQGREVARKTIDEVVIRGPITLSPDDQVLKAASTMVTRQIRRLPVVEEGRLVGTIARADVCRAVLDRRSGQAR